MARADAKTIKAQLKKGEIHNLYYIYGSDVSGVESLTKAIIKKAVGDNEEFALNRISGKGIDIRTFRDMTEMIPMMSEYNCILVNDYNCEEQKEDAVKQLTGVLKDIPSNTIIIFNITGFDVKGGKKTITGKNKKLSDFVDKNGIICEIPVKTPVELSKSIAAAVSSRGGLISLENARELAAMCLCDSLTIGNEINKLCAYANGREITKEMITELVVSRSDITVYNLANAVCSFNRAAAFEALDELLDQHMKREIILSVISNAFIDIYRAVCAKQSGKRVSDMMQDFGYRYEFVVKNAFKDSSRMSAENIRKCISILRDTAVQLNTTAADERVTLEKAVSQMLMTSDRRRRNI